MLNSPAKQTAMKFYNAFNNRDIAALNLVLQSDWIIHPEIPGAGSNLQKYIPIASALLTAFPDAHFNVEGMTAEDNIVAVRAVLTGTHKDTWLGVAPSGNRIQIRAHDFHRIEVERIAESWHVEDWLLGIQQMNATT